MDSSILTRKVYITNFAGHDFAAAKSYGELVPITTGYVSFQSLDRIKFQVLEGIKDSTDEDWLLLSGITVVCVIAAVGWFNMHDKVKLLVHDKKHKDTYREMILTHHNFVDIGAELYRERNEQKRST